MMSLTECTQIDTVLDGEGSLLSEGAMQHLDQCPHCRSLYDWMSEASRAASISPAREQRIAHALRMSLPHVKPLPPLRVSIASLIVLFVALSGGLIAVMGTAGIARASLTQIVGIGVLLTTGVCLFSAMLAKQVRPGSYQHVPWQMALAAIGFALLTAMGVLFPWDLAPRFVGQGLPCVLAGVSMAVPAAALLWLAVRHGTALSIITTGGTLGATAGLLGMTVLQVKCPHQEAPHLLAWHGSVLLIAVGSGVLAGWLLQRSSDTRYLPNRSRAMPR
jgi:hypothetical protein